MSTIKIAVKDNRAVLIGNVDLVAGTIGQLCTFYFDEDWEKLPNKKITYKVGQTIFGTYDIVNRTTTLPANVLTTAGLPLEIGITGYSHNRAIVTPTSWCLIGTIQPGAVIAPPPNTSGADHIIYDGGIVFARPENDSCQHIIYDGGVV